jgi:hypothetical protein
VQATVGVASMHPPHVSPETSPLHMRMGSIAALLPWGMLCLALWCSPTWAQASGAKKLIYYGWGIRDTQISASTGTDGTDALRRHGIIVPIDRQAGSKADGRLTISSVGR